MGTVTVHSYNLWVLIFAIIVQLHSSTAQQDILNNNTVFESVSSHAKPNNSDYIFGIKPLPFDRAWGIPGLKLKDVDELENWVPPAELVKSFPYYLSGFDKDNRPIWISEWGRFDMVKAVVDKKTEELFDKYCQLGSYTLIKSLALKATKDKPVTDLVFIIDLEGIDPALMANHKVNFIGETVINLVRPIFSRLRGRVETYGTNKANYEPQLLKSCPKNQLPEWYGGQKNHKPVYVFG